MDDKVWVPLITDDELKGKLARELNISEVLASLLLNRGMRDVQEAKSFLSASIDTLVDPFSLQDMEEGVDRIIKGIKNREKIVIYGDYDTDGVTATALLYSLLKDLGSNVSYYIPHRIDEGYGLHIEFIERAKEEGISLIITVDCGTGAFEEAEIARDLGIDLVITDHHIPTNPNDRISKLSSGASKGAEICEADIPNPNEQRTENREQKTEILINPKLSENRQLENLSGVGVAYKLAQALLSKLKADYDLNKNLDLVCLGTICDIVPLIGENRVLVKEGLRIISRAKRIGLQELISSSGLSGRKITANSIAFILGPRLNSAGRLSSALTSLSLLLASSKEEGEKLARSLERENRKRQDIQRRVLREAREIIEREKLDNGFSICLAKKDWHPGVLGIVANKIVDLYHSPVRLLSWEKEVARGSGRSTEGFNLFESLSPCRDLLLSFGGHRKACGLTLPASKVEELKERWEVSASNESREEDLREKIEIEAFLRFSQINPQLTSEIDKLSPFGEGNRPPLFATREVEIQRFSGSFGNNHLKVWLKEGERFLEGIAFGKGGQEEKACPGRKVDIAYSLDKNSYQGLNRIRLNLKSIKLK